MFFRPKWMAVRPAIRTEKYKKFGFVLVESEFYRCPRCKSALNAGPNYQPNYCDRCGQKVNFVGIEWTQEREIGYTDREAEPV